MPLKIENKIEPLAVSVRHACIMLGGISRSQLYRFFADGTITRSKVGGRTVVKTQDLKDFLNGTSQTSEAA